MRSLAGRVPDSFALAVAIAGACAAATGAALALAPTPTPAGEAYFAYSLEVVLAQAASVVGMILLAIWLRHRQEATAYALLAGAALVAGWGTGAVDSNAIESGNPNFAFGFLAGLSTLAAPTAILALFASRPPRRLAWWTPAVLAAMVAGAGIGAGLETWTRAQEWNGSFFEGAHTGLPGLAGWLTSPLPVLVAFLAAALGSLRNEALRFVPGSLLPARTRALERGLVMGFAIALLVALAMAGAWMMTPMTSELADVEGRADSARLYLLPLLAALVGIVVARWSAYVAWTALATSLGVSAVGLFGNAIEVAVAPFATNPNASLAPPSAWIVLVVLGWLVGVGALAFAWIALGAARASIPGRPARRTPGPVALTILTLGVVASATFLRNRGVGADDEHLLEIALWAGAFATIAFTFVVLVGAAEALRGRLVPAVAEAEAVARRPFRPFRYLETVAIEAITSRAALRRTATAAERSKLASDLHAELLPSLAEIAAQYEAGAPKEDVALRMRQLEGEIRDLMAERRLVVLEEFGIVEAIEWLLGRAEERRTLDVELSVNDRSTSERPPREVERAAFRIAQLAVENALRHAAPTRLALDVLARPDEVRISISDDGQGFATESGEAGREQFGIADMRSQAADVRGDVRVDAPPAGGTTVTFAWPAI